MDVPKENTQSQLLIKARDDPKIDDRCVIVVNIYDPYLAEWALRSSLRYHL